MSLHGKTLVVVAVLGCLNTGVLRAQTCGSPVELGEEVRVTHTNTPSSAMYWTDFREIRSAAGGMMVFWSQKAAEGIPGYAVTCARVDASGSIASAMTLMEGTPLGPCSGSFIDSPSANVSAASTGAAYAAVAELNMWETRVGCSPVPRIVFRTISPDGEVGAQRTVTDPFQVVPSESFTANMEPRIAWNGSDFGILSSSQRNATLGSDECDWGYIEDFDTEIYFSRVDAVGNKLGIDEDGNGVPDDVRVTDFPLYHLYTNGNSGTPYTNLVWTGSGYAVAYAGDPGAPCSLIGEVQVAVFLLLFDPSGGNPHSFRVFRHPDGVSDSRPISLAWAGDRFAVTYDTVPTNRLAIIDASGSAVLRDLDLNGRDCSVEAEAGEFVVACARGSSRGATPGSEVFLTRYDLSGNVLSDLQLSTNPADVWYPTTTWNGTNFGVIWIDSRDTSLLYNGEVYFTRVSVMDCANPTSSAGQDRTVEERTLVVLDGRGSDPSGGTLTYSWAQLAGPTVSLSDSSDPNAEFVAPDVLPGGAVLTFALVVTNSSGAVSEPSNVNLTIKNVNNRPVAETTGNLTVPENSLVSLDGRPSYDVDDEPLTFFWVQFSGMPVTLTGETSPTPSFTAPAVGSTGETLSFQLIVNDSIDDSGPALVDVSVTNVNQAPTVNAGADASVPEDTEVLLAGSGSDPDGDALSYLWTQTEGPIVSLSDPTSPTPTLRAPFVTPGGESLTFSLVVSDGALASATDELVLTILNTNDPPSCISTTALPGQLWPPNHKLLEVGIGGIVDPQGDAISISVTAVTSDEPTSGLGDGDSSPDAVIQGDGALLRAERWDQGDGRVYTVHFTATDSNGESCVGAVRVGVAKNARRENAAADSGQFYDATTP